MGTYLDDLWNDLEKTWDLAMEINDLPEAERADVAAAWNKFKASELVDPSRTEQEAAGQLPPRKVFCTNIYGIQFNPETKYWIPFRQDRKSTRLNSSH